MKFSQYQAWYKNDKECSNLTIIPILRNLGLVSEFLESIVKYFHYFRRIFSLDHCDEIPSGVTDSDGLVDLSLCGDLHAARNNAFGQERRLLGRQLPLRGRERRDCSQAGDTDLRW